MHQTFGILAPVDAGKTTLSERLLYLTGARHSCGRVDDGSTLLDSDELEHRRGITIFTGAAHFTYRDGKYTLLDTPGHVDFSSETARAVRAMDFAVLLISAPDGVRGHTLTLWRLLERERVPVLLFLNKCDQPGADIDRVMAEIHSRLSPDAVLLDGSPKAMEDVAERDEELLEAYLDGGDITALWKEKMRGFIAKRTLFPCICGAALRGEGVEALLDCIADYVRPNQTDKPDLLPFAVRRDKSGTRWTFVKINRGTLHVKQLVDGEKLNEIRRYSGEHYETVPEAPEGSVCAVSGLTTPLSDGGLTPLFQSRVIHDEALPPKTVLGWLRLLEEENPELAVEWNEEAAEIRVHVMGAIQLEILQELVARRFGAALSFGPCTMIYRETIAAPVCGYGHFEPLRHYAEVHLRLEPTERGSGISFSSELSGDVLAAQHQRIICHWIETEGLRGVLTGSPLTDVRVVLTNGRAHEKHTEGGDFREAALRAVRQGLMKAESILLEPWQALCVYCSTEEIGWLLAELQAQNCSFDAPDIRGEQVVVHGRGPASELMDLGEQLLSVSGGRASLQLQFCGFEPCANAEAVCTEIGYEPERDTAHPVWSVFCSHGAGYPVPWDEVEAHIHCEKRG